MSKVEQLTKENETIRFHNRSIEREYKGLHKQRGVVDWKVNNEIATLYGILPESLGAIRQFENGREGIEYGVQKVHDDVRKWFPPEYWQPAMAAKIMIQEMTKICYGLEKQGVFYQSSKFSNSFEHLGERYNFKYRHHWANSVHQLTNQNLYTRYGKDNVVKFSRKRK